MQLDVRGPRFAAAVTSVVLAIVIITGSGWLALTQAIVFAIGTANLRHAPYAVLYRVLVAPRLAAPVEFEPAQPVRFAQGVGLVFAVIAAGGYLAGAPLIGTAAAAFALAAAFLNAAFRFCLGCEMYLLVKRVSI